ncbi:MAG: NAD(P)/FAD-dependent oxidoreductase, partial [Hominimerdicola sp.]
MPIIINQIKCPLDAKEEQIISKALKKLKNNKSKAYDCHVYKTSLDARNQNDIHFVHSIICTLGSEKEEQKLCSADSSLTFVSGSSFNPVISDKKADGKVVIAGFGPAGMFCGLVLAEHGYKPIILERGSEVEKRTAAVSEFWRTGQLDINSNVQFGEGGAGTFSDGKLTTRIKDPLCRYVMERFVEFGAPKEILHKAKPHIGTDNLRNIVKAIRQKIIECGGEVRFENKLSDFYVKNNKADKILCTSGEEKVSALVLALGHSARDTFEMLDKKNIFLESKPFSVGARIEHKQSAVEESLYGKHAGNPLLPKGEYQLSWRNKEGRGVYTFCMCPGGTVVPSSSEQFGVVTNGMSEFARDGENANAALVVAVTPDDFGKNPLDGIAFARKIEQNAYKATGSYKAAGTTVGGFLEGKPNINSNIDPTYALGLEAVNYGKIFPKFVTDMMTEGLEQFGRKMACFKDKNAVLSAPETRTSSPVRITRNEKMTSISIENLYPCGEGAGYAGG